MQPNEDPAMFAGVLILSAVRSFRRDPPPDYYQKFASPCNIAVVGLRQPHNPAVPCNPFGRR